MKRSMGHNDKPLLVGLSVLLLLWSSVARADRVEVRRTHLAFSGLARSCAGGVAVDGVHDFTLIGTFYDENNALLSGETLKFSFEGNKGHDYGDRRLQKRAKFIAGAGQTLLPSADPNTANELMQATTDAAGQVRVQVLSSDIISNDIKVKVKWIDAQGQEKEVGSKACDFAEAVGKRRFPNQYNPYEDYPGDDEGWLFNQAWLISPNEETTAKFYLKFMVDPELGDVNGNWVYVNGHYMLFEVGDIEMDEDVQEVLTTGQDEFATVQGSEILTQDDGAATVVVMAGQRVQEARVIHLNVYDQSQWDN